jgi:hypothetical protein
MTLRVAKIVSAFVCFSLAGCYRGYKSAKELETDERGPKACAASCKELGLEMSAFVLVERQTSGCVCSPPEKKEKIAAPVAAAVTTQVVDQEKQKAVEQQRREETVTAPQ